MGLVFKLLIIYGVSSILVLDGPTARATDADYIKVDVIPDKVALRFPEPIYGFLKITNASNKPEYFPTAISGQLKLEVNGTVTNLLYSGPQPVSLFLAPAGFSFTIPFTYHLTNKNQIAAVLQDNATVKITLEVEVHKTEFVDSILSSSLQADQYRFWGRKASAVTTLRYSKLNNVFKDDVDKNFVNKTLDPESWPEQSPFDSVIPASPPIPGEYPVKFNFAVTSCESQFKRITPIARLFPENFQHLQSVVRCDTATWRLLELYRQNQSCNYLPRTRENGLSAMEAGMVTLKCAGRAEAYYLESFIHRPETGKIATEGDQKLPNGYFYERLNAQLPFLSNMANEHELINTFQSQPFEIPRNPILRKIIDSDERTWNAAINDITLPSPLEVSLKQSEEAGEPNPCPCYDAAAEAQLQNEFAKPKTLPE